MNHHVAHVDTDFASIWPLGGPENVGSITTAVDMVTRFPYSYLSRRRRNTWRSERSVKFHVDDHDVEE
jgi:hypothetical protein